MRLEEGWSTLFFTWGMVFLTAWTLNEANYLQGLEIFMMVATIAVFTGFVVAKSELSEGTSNLIAFVYGAAVIVWLVGLRLPADLSWRERIFELLQRQVIWIGKAISGGTSRDELIFVIQTALVFWIIGYTAAWYTFRVRYMWRAILPSGLVLLSVVYNYYGSEPMELYLGLYCLLALMYIVRTHLMEREGDWKLAAVRYDRSITAHFLQAGLLASVFVMFFAWSLPALSASQEMSSQLATLTSPIKTFQENWTRLYSSLRSYGTANNDLYQGDLVLGGPRSVGDTPVMDVYVSQQLPYIYWQADALATYQDGAWKPLDHDAILHIPGEDGRLDVPNLKGRTLLQQEVVNYIPNASTMYGAPEVIETDVQMFYKRRFDDRGQILIDGLKSRYLLGPGESYQVTSRVTTADAQSLRLAGNGYPAWVTSNFLQGVEFLTPETVALAEEIVAGYDNPYDKAIAMRDYLRANITYNDQIAAVPDGEEPIHYTLFVSKEGYCNYYAAAMAMMLRSQNIPTRVVRGYAQGELLDTDTDGTAAYRVRANNAHTWVEVYFPEYGWVQFEPTAAIPTVDRAETAADAGNEPVESSGLNDDILEGELGLQDQEDVDVPDEDVEGIQNNEEQSGAVGVGAGGGVPWQRALTVAGLLVAVGGVFAGATVANQRVEGDVMRSYGRLNQWSSWLDIIFKPSQTPYERASELATVLPEGRQSIRKLTQEFVLRVFSPHGGDEGFDPQAEWKVLRPLLLRKAIAHRLAKLRRDRDADPSRDRFDEWHSE